MKKKIFIVDDEKDIREILKVNLIQEGYDVYLFSSASEAAKGLNSEKPDLIILDIMMEGKDGFEFCRDIRSNEKFKSIPVIFLSARSEEFDKVLGLELGGDDFITKPFSVKELKARIKAILRRAQSTPEKYEDMALTYKGVELNTEQFSLSVDGEDIKLTKTEFNILRLFMENPGKVFTIQQLFEHGWGEEFICNDKLFTPSMF